MLNKPWNPVFGAGVPQSPSGGGGGGGAWTFLGNTPALLAPDLKVTGLVGHTHYCAMVRGLISQFPFIELLDMRISDDNGASFYSTFDHEVRQISRHANALAVAEFQATLDSTFNLIGLGPDIGPNGLAQHGVWGWIWFWEPSLAASREFLCEWSFVYENESNFATRTKGFGQYPSFTNGIGAINAFQLFNFNGFQAVGSVDLYGIT